jgi:hypothetical protein
MVSRWRRPAASLQPPIMIVQTGSAMGLFLGAAVQAALTTSATAMAWAR